MDNPILNVVTNALQRAANATGALTGLATIASYGLCALWAGAAQATFAALAAFGAVGFLEVFHSQRQAQLVKRSQAPRRDENDALLESRLSANSQGEPKVFKQLSYGGFDWNVIGFEEIPFPITVTGPLCPACGGHLAERFVVKFPARTRISIFCGCGFSHASNYFMAELKSDVQQMAGTPV